MDNRFLHMVPLVLFTVLAIIAGGLIITVAFLLCTEFDLADIGRYFLWIFGLVSVGGIISLFHLGQKRRSLRAVLGVNHSWLSLEVFFAGVLIVSAGFGYLAIHNGWSLFLIDLAAGAVLVSSFILNLSIAMVYNLSTRLTWNGFSNTAAPIVSSLLLGSCLFVFTGAKSKLNMIFLVAWILDFVLARMRNLAFHEIIRNKHRLVFAHLLPLTNAIHLSRTFLSLGIIFITISSFNASVPVMVILDIILDRFAFYSSAAQVTPTSEIALLKKARFS